MLPSALPSAVPQRLPSLTGLQMPFAMTSGHTLHEGLSPAASSPAQTQADLRLLASAADSDAQVPPLCCYQTFLESHHMSHLLEQCGFFELGKLLVAQHNTEFLQDEIHEQ